MWRHAGARLGRGLARMSPRHLATSATNTGPPPVTMVGAEMAGEGCSELRRFEVQLQPRPGAVTEEELEEALEAAAEGVEDISEHWEDAMAAVRRTEALFPLYKHTEEDSLRIRATQPTGTLASLVNQAPCLQSLVDLGVQLHVWDRRGKLDLGAKLDFGRDVAPLITFLTDIGVDIAAVGKVLTFAPELVEERAEDLRARVAYLASKNFSRDEISSIVTQAPRWLLFSVRGIDARLGFFQKTFGFLGPEVRQLACFKPNLIIWSGTPAKVKVNLFSYNEEMGFTPEELKAMVLKCPDILKPRPGKENFLAQFELLHNEAKIPHELLAQFPSCFTAQPVNTKPRLQFLKALGRDQWDPTKPNFINPELLTKSTDAEFCEKAAKCSEDLFDKFMKSL